MKTINTSITLIMAAALLAFAPVGVQAAETPAKGEVKSHHEGPPPAAGEIVKLTADSIEIKDHMGITTVGSPNEVASADGERAKLNAFPPRAVAFGLQPPEQYRVR